MNITQYISNEEFLIPSTNQTDILNFYLSQVTDLDRIFGIIILILIFITIIIIIVHKIRKRRLLRKEKSVY